MPSKGKINPCKESDSIEDFELLTHLKTLNTKINFFISDKRHEDEKKMIFCAESYALKKNGLLMEP